MESINKGKSPFYPGQPVPVQFFAGRAAEIQKITRAIKQVELGKPQAIFLTGEYGIGKSSLAGLMRHSAETYNHILGIHVLLGGAETLEDVATKTVEAVIRTQVYEPSTTGKIQNFLSKYISGQELFGISLNLEALKTDSPTISHGFLPFLRELLNRVKDNGIKGIMLILDEINGITSNPKFAHFIKSLVDENALSQEPLPLLLMLCGVEDRRKEMIQKHQPVERIFDIVEIKSMNENEMKDFFNTTFKSVGMQIEDAAMFSMCWYSAGFPKIMHVIGDAIFWIDKDNVVDTNDAVEGILLAAGEVGRKFIDQQVYNALKSKDYHSVLKKLGKAPDLSFKKGELEKDLSENEKKKFNNFLQRMKKLNVLKSGKERGEYIFQSRLVRLYINLKSLERES
ncbi:MAG: ATP-binding protein [Phycisphaerae bacterium]